MAPISNAFKDKVLALSVTAIYVYDLVKGINVYINQEYTNLTGYTLDQINGMTQEEFFSLFHPSEQAAIAAHMEEVIASNPEQIIEIEYRFKKANGQWMWCLSRDAVFDRGKDGQPTQFMGTFIDVTDRKNAESALIETNIRLEQANLELGQFVYIASHDLQEPLNTVNSFTQLLVQDYKGQFDKRADKYLQFISQASTRMRDLVKGLLDYSRIGLNKKMTIVDCNKIIKAIQEDYGLKITKTGTTFDIGNLPQLKGYETELRLLFQNLISNAIKFRKPNIGPHIQIMAQQEPGYWKLSFKDNGIGILDKHKEKIFLIFQRLNNKSKYKGTGIGLAHCRKIVDLHNGKIWVESQLDKGSTFYVKLPNNN